MIEQLKNEIKMEIKRELLEMLLKSYIKDMMQEKINDVPVGMRAIKILRIGVGNG
jgi:hypothetical protein